MATFKLKYFEINQDNCAMKIGTDSMVLGAWVGRNNNFSPKNILDIGTGTGVLALVMAQYFPNAIVDAIETDFGAAQCAQLNFSNNDLGKNCKMICHDFVTYDFSLKYDLIISNPPYFENSTKNPALSKSIARHADFMPIELFIKKTAYLLTEKGVFYLVFPADNNSIYLEASKNGLFPRNILKVYGKQGLLKRQCIQFTKEKTNKIIEEKIVIRNNDGSYTSEYIELTKELHGVAL